LYLSCWFGGIKQYSEIIVLIKKQNEPFKRIPLLSLLLLAVVFTTRFSMVNAKEARVDFYNELS
jgi:hypothetical protein